MAGDVPTEAAGADDTAEATMRPRWLTVLLAVGARLAAALLGARRVACSSPTARMAAREQCRARWTWASRRT